MLAHVQVDLVNVRLTLHVLTLDQREIGREALAVDLANDLEKEETSDE